MSVIIAVFFFFWGHIPRAGGILKSCVFSKILQMSDNDPNPSEESYKGMNFIYFFPKIIEVMMKYAFIGHKCHHQRCH